MSNQTIQIQNPIGDIKQQLKIQRNNSNRCRYIKEQQFIHGSTVLGDDVWIGSGASVLMNARIGDGSIVSSNSLVSGVVPEFTVFAGVPARFIRNR